VLQHSQKNRLDATGDPGRDRKNQTDHFEPENRSLGQPLFLFFGTAYIRISNLFAFGGDFARMRIGFMVVIAVAPIRAPSGKTCRGNSSLHYFG
jgi:hypothetical protein